MRDDIPIALLTHFGKPTSPARCGLEIVRRDGFTLRITNYDIDRTVDGALYRARFGGTVSDLQGTAALNVDNSELTGRYLLSAIGEEDLRAGLWDYATFRRFLYNPLRPSDGIYGQQSGKFGQVTCSRLQFIIELRGLMQFLQQAFGYTYGAACRWKTYSTECGLDVEDFTVTGRLNGVSADGMTLYADDRTEDGPTGGLDIVSITNANPCVITLSAALGLPAGSVVTLSDIDEPSALNGAVAIRNPSGASFEIDVDTSDTGIFPPYSGSGGKATPQGADSGYFDGGPLTILDGENSVGAIVRTVKSYVPGQFFLQEPFPFPLLGYERYSAVAGDDHTFTTCRVKFSNGRRHGGFPYIAGQDHRMQVGRSA